MKMLPKTATSVAAILEKELDSMIGEWKRQVSLVPSLTNIPLSDADRTGHLTKLFGEVLCRLQGNRNTEPLVSIAAAAHGRLRFAQGYSVAMLVEVLLDVGIIADEADRQLEEAVGGFMAAQAAA
jgi:hypothetical protein